MENEEDPKGYRWETEYEKTWEAIREDEHGLLTSSLEEIVHKSRRKRLLEKKNLKLGMMRHLYVIIDCSEAMLEPDLKPTRYLCTLKLLEKFIEEYFDQNPISQLGIITTKNKKADKLTELAGNPKQHISVLQNSAKTICIGEPSLQNALELATQTLRFMPTHTSREVLVIFGSLTTCDPSDIYETVDSLVAHNIRCSIIGLAAELVVCRKITKATQGSYNVVIDDSHFQELLFDQVSPPAATSSTESSLIRMGFPYHQSKTDLEQQKRDHLEKEIEEGRRQLDEQMEYAIYEHEANLLRERLRHMEEQSSLIQRERELRREEEMRREEARRAREMLLRQQQDEILRSDMRRRQEENMMMGPGYGEMMDREHGMSNPGPISPSMAGDPMSSSASGYGPNGMMQGPGMGMPPPRQSRFDQPPMGTTYSPGGDPMNEMGGPPNGPGAQRGMHPPMPPREMMDNMEEYGMEAKRRRY